MLIIITDVGPILDCYHLTCSAYNLYKSELNFYLRTWCVRGGRHLGRRGIGGGRGGGMVSLAFIENLQLALG